MSTNVSTTASAPVPMVQSQTQLSSSLPSGQQPSTYQTPPTQQQQNPQMATSIQVQQPLGMCRVLTHSELGKWTTKLYILTIVFFPVCIPGHSHVSNSFMQHVYSRQHGLYPMSICFLDYINNVQKTWPKNHEWDQEGRAEKLCWHDNPC